MPYLEMWHLLEGRRLLEGGAYFNVDSQRCGDIRGRRLFEARRLLEEIQYISHISYVSYVLKQRNFHQKKFFLYFPPKTNFLRPLETTYHLAHSKTSYTYRKKKQILFIFKIFLYLHKTEISKKIKTPVLRETLFVLLTGSHAMPVVTRCCF